MVVEFYVFDPPQGGAHSEQVQRSREYAIDSSAPGDSIVGGIVGDVDRYKGLGDAEGQCERNN